MEINNLTKEQTNWIAENCHCPKSYGFEGPDTFFRCGQCIICKCIDAKEKEDIE